ncbi:MAG: LytTR family transcriptional regulator [Clostridia bacterium]
MRKKLIPEQEIINLSKELMQCFYNRTIGDNLKYIADDFMWIGAFDFQYTTSLEEFLSITQSEFNSVPFVMMNEEFSLIYKSVTCYIVSAKFNLATKTEHGTVINTHTRLTIVWKYIGDDLKIAHVHGSNAQDIPLIPTNKSDNNTQNTDFMQYLTTVGKHDYSKKLSFRDVTGAYMYFLENEILYLKADLQNTYLHTKNKTIRIPGVLSETSKHLPENFYRIHKSFVVNANLVKSLKRYIVTLVSDEELPISKDKFIAFREFISN